MALINKLSAIGNAIREKTGKTDLFTLDQMPEEIKGIETGGNGFAYTKYAKTLTFTTDFEEVTEDVYLDLSKMTSIRDLMRTVVNCEKLTVKVSDLCTSFYGAFWGTLANEGLKTIEIVGDTSSVTTFGSAFRNRKNLESVLGEIDFSSSANNITDLFMNNQILKEFYPKAETIKVSMNLNNSPLYTDESIQAIINGLADLTGETAKTLTLHATVKGKLTEEQIASITSKNWTLA